MSQPGIKGRIVEVAGRAYDTAGKEMPHVQCKLVNARMTAIAPVQSNLAVAGRKVYRGLNWYRVYPIVQRHKRDDKSYSGAYWKS